MDATLSEEMERVGLVVATNMSGDISTIAIGEIAAVHILNNAQPVSGSVYLKSGMWFGMSGSEAARVRDDWRRYLIRTASIAPARP